MTSWYLTRAFMVPHLSSKFTRRFSFSDFKYFQPWWKFQVNENYSMLSTYQKSLLWSPYCWNAQWLFALYLSLSSPRQEQLQVPLFPELSNLFWVNTAPGCRKERVDTEHKILPQRLIKEEKRHLRLKSLPFLLNLLQWNHTHPVGPGPLPPLSRTIEDSCFDFIVTEQRVEWGIEWTHGGLCPAPSLQEGTSPELIWPRTRLVSQQL